MNTQVLDIPLLLPSGPDCERCVTRLQSALRSIKGVSEAEVAGERGTIQIAYDPDLVTLSRIEEQARRIGADISASTEHETIGLKDLDCPDCASSIEKAVNRLPGVIWAGANFAAAQMHVEFQRGAATLPQICKVVEGHGVRACALNPTAGEAINGGQPRSEAQPSWLAENRRLVTTIGTFLLTAAGAAAGRWSQPASIALYALAILAGGWSTARSGWMALRARSLDMNVLMTIAVIGAAAIGDWLEGATVVGLYSLGNLLQAGAMERTRRSLRSLMQLTSNQVRALRGSREMEMAVDQVEVGELILVRPGERIPLDGIIASGRSAVNEAPITGESVPKEKGPEDGVFAGTLNGSGALTVRATRRFRDTTLARIIHRVEEAQAQRAPTQQLIDRFARVYTPTVVALAVVVAVLPPLAVGLWSHGAASAVWSDWFLRGLSLLIIACPCALVIATPVAIVTAIGNASRNGILIKGGAYLEEAGRIRALLYDKTGTLTTGVFQLDEIVPLADLSENDCLAIAAAIESRSEHPLAAAFHDANHARNGHLHLEVGEAASIPGMGARGRVDGREYLVGSARLMEKHGIALANAGAELARLDAEGKTLVVLAAEGRALALFGLSDQANPRNAEAVSALNALGLTTQAMLTGDNARVAAAVAKSAGVERVHAGLLPEEKLELVRQYQSEIGAVGMVGDGINDAPALAAANVGIAMGAAGSDTAMETADIALMGADISRLPYLIRLSRRAQAVMRQNIAFSLVTKAALVVGALTTGIPLWLAIVGDVGVSLVVTLNALRLHGAVKA